MNWTAQTIKKKKSKLKWIIICAVSLIAVIAAVIVLVINLNKLDVDESLEEAEKYMAAMKYEEAAATYENIIEAEPECVEAYLSLAEVYYDKMGNIDKAIQVLEIGYKNTKSKKISEKLEELKNIKAYNPIESVSLSKTELELEAEETYTLTYDVSPENADRDINAKWTSSDENIATVDAEGNVTAVKEGTATITVSITENIPYSNEPVTHKADCTLKVNKKSIKLSDVSWAVEPTIVCDDVIAVMDVMPQGREKIIGQIGDYNSRVFFYDGENAGLMGFDGIIYAASSEKVRVDWFNGFSSQSGSIDIYGEKFSGGGGGFETTYYWNEAKNCMTAVHVDGIEKLAKYQSEYMSAYKSISIDGEEKVYNDWSGREMTSINANTQDIVYNDYYRLINKDGTLVIDEKYEDIKYTEQSNSIVGDYAVVKKNGKYGYVKSDGTLLTDYIYDDAYPFHNGMAAVKKDGKAGFIDESGNIEVDFIFEETRSQYCGLAFAKTDGKWGVINLYKLPGMEQGEVSEDEMYIDAAVSFIKNNNQYLKKYVYAQSISFVRENEDEPYMLYVYEKNAIGERNGVLYKYYTNGLFIKYKEYCCENWLVEMTSEDLIIKNVNEIDEDTIEDIVRRAWEGRNTVRLNGETTTEFEAEHATESVTKPAAESPTKLTESVTTATEPPSKINAEPEMEPTTKTETATEPVVNVKSDIAGMYAEEIVSGLDPNWCYGLKEISLYDINEDGVMDLRVSYDTGNGGNIKYMIYSEGGISTIYRADNAAGRSWYSLYRNTQTGKVRIVAEWHNGWIPEGDSYDVYDEQESGSFVQTGKAVYDNFAGNAPKYTLDDQNTDKAAFDTYVNNISSGYESIQWKENNVINVDKYYTDCSEDMIKELLSSYFN